MFRDRRYAISLSHMMAMCRITEHHTNHLTLKTVLMKTGHVSGSSLLAWMKCIYSVKTTLIFAMFKSYFRK